MYVYLFILICKSRSRRCQTISNYLPIIICRSTAMDPLDQLIYFLENESDGSEDAGDNDEQLAANVNEVTREERPTPMAVSPRVSPRQRPVQIYRRSSSAARRLLNFQEETHCYFCNTNVATPLLLETHFRSSQLCLTKYQRRFKVRSVDSILIILFKCIYCNVKTSMTTEEHIRSNPQCFDQYKERWNVDNLR